MAKGKKEDSLEGHVSGQANKPLTRPAHALPFDTVLQELKANGEDGLTHAEAKARHEEYGPNDIGDDGGVQPGKILLRQVANAMTLVSNSISSSQYNDTNMRIGTHSRHGCQFRNQIMD